MTDTATTAPVAEQSDSVQTQDGAQTPSPDLSADHQQGTDAPATDPDANAPPKEPVKKKKHGLHKRIDELTGKQRQAERERDLAKANAQTLELQLRQMQQQQLRNPQMYQQPADPYAANPYPQEAYPPQGVQQPYDEEAAYKTLMDDIAKRTSAEQARAATEERALKFISEVKDPDTVDFLMSPNSGITDEMGEVILELPPERGQALAQALSNNPRIVSEIASLPVHLQATRLATMEAAASNAPPAQAVSGAPAPAPTVGGKGAVSTDPSKMTPEEFVAWRRSGGK